MDTGSCVLSSQTKSRVAGLSMSGVHTAARAQHPALSNLRTNNEKQTHFPTGILLHLQAARIINIIQNHSLRVNSQAACAWSFGPATSDLVLARSSGSGAVGGFVSSLSIPQDTYATPQKHTIQTAVYMVSKVGR
jgi:hypothetical protein